MKTLLIPVLLLLPTSLLTMNENCGPATLTKAPPLAIEQQEPAKVGGVEKETKDPYRQFDFWVGNWRCETQDGKAAGKNKITLECGNKVLRENWTGAGGGVGTSLNIYDALQKTWHQTWVDQYGTLLQLDGNLDDAGNMVLRGTRPGKEGKTVKHQIKWSPLDEKVRQTWTVSNDDGKTWKVLADLNYIRVKE
ncbi:MAG: hypothetical protein HQ519_12030 [Planctomycetes bacterium]|nr:hypothetical protein [Planctomycetota bacterium]